MARPIYDPIRRLTTLVQRVILHLHACVQHTATLSTLSPKPCFNPRRLTHTHRESTTLRAPRIAVKPRSRGSCSTSTSLSAVKHFSSSVSLPHAKNHAKNWRKPDPNLHLSAAIRTFDGVFQRILLSVETRHTHLALIFHPRYLLSHMPLTQTTHNLAYYPKIRFKFYFYRSKSSSGSSSSSSSSSSGSKKILALPVLPLKAAPPAGTSEA